MLEYMYVIRRNWRCTLRLPFPIGEERDQFDLDFSTRVWLFFAVVQSDRKDIIINASFSAGVIKSNSSWRLEFIWKYIQIFLWNYHPSQSKKRNNNYWSIITKKKKRNNLFRENKQHEWQAYKYPYCGGIIDTSRPMVKFKPAESTIIRR